MGAAVSATVAPPPRKTAPRHPNFKLILMLPPASPPGRYRDKMARDNTANMAAELRFRLTVLNQSETMAQTRV